MISTQLLEVVEVFESLDKGQSVYLEQATFYVTMSLEEPLTDEERKRLREILSDPEALDYVLDEALRGWRRSRTWTKKS